VQCVALEVADYPAIEVELVQVAAAVVQVSLPSRSGSQQAIIGVVAKLDAVAEGIDPLDQPATAVITQAGDVLGRVGIGGQLASGVDVIAVDSAVRYR